MLKLNPIKPKLNSIKTPDCSNVSLGAQFHRGRKEQRVQRVEEPVASEELTDRFDICTEICQNISL